MICTNCMIYMALGVFVGWNMIAEINNPKLNQSWEDMRDEVMEEERIKRIKKGSD